MHTHTRMCATRNNTKHHATTPRNPGERRIRVHTHCIPVVSTVKEVFDLANVNAVVNLMAKQAVNVALLQSLPKARDQVRARSSHAHANATRH